MIPKVFYNKWENGLELLDTYIKSTEDAYNGLRSIAKISHTDLDYLKTLVCNYVISQVSGIYGVQNIRNQIVPWFFGHLHMQGGQFKCPWSRLCKELSKT